MITLPSLLRPGATWHAYEHRAELLGGDRIVGHEVLEIIHGWVYEGERPSFTLDTWGPLDPDLEAEGREALAVARALRTPKSERTELDACRILAAINRGQLPEDAGRKETP